MEATVTDELNLSPLFRKVPETFLAPWLEPALSTEEARREAFGVPPGEPMDFDTIALSNRSLAGDVTGRAHYLVDESGALVASQAGTDRLCFVDGARPIPRGIDLACVEEQLFDGRPVWLVQSAITAAALGAVGEKALAFHQPHGWRDVQMSGRDFLHRDMAPLFGRGLRFIIAYPSWAVRNDLNVTMIEARLARALMERGERVGLCRVPSPTAGLPVEGELGPCGDTIEDYLADQRDKATQLGIEDALRRLRRVTEPCDPAERVHRAGQGQGWAAEGAEPASTFDLLSDFSFLASAYLLSAAEFAEVASAIQVRTGVPPEDIRSRANIFLPWVLQGRSTWRREYLPPLSVDAPHPRRAEKKPETLADAVKASAPATPPAQGLSPEEQSLAGDPEEVRKFARGDTPLVPVAPRPGDKDRKARIMRDLRVGKNLSRVATWKKHLAFTSTQMARTLGVSVGTALRWLGQFEKRNWVVRSGVRESSILWRLTKEGLRQ